MPHAPYKPGQRYASRLRVAETDVPAINEAFIQRLWFEEAFRNPLKLTDGGEVTITQPGFWNHTAGPDFTNASLTDEKGESLQGAVELHLSPEDWHRHGHHEDPAYDEVILHAVWKRGTRNYFAQTNQFRHVREVELSSQLRLPLSDLILLPLQTTPEEQNIGARIGACERVLASIPDDHVLDLLKEAGWHRFEIKQPTLANARPAAGLQLGPVDRYG